MVSNYEEKNWLFVCTYLSDVFNILKASHCLVYALFRAPLKTFRIIPR